jgi:hypothetical protein
MDRPDWHRRLNYLGSAVGGARHLVSLDPEEMLANAQATAGLSDFGDDDWREAYDQLVASIAKDVDLTTLGRLMSRADILRSLRNRLFVVDALKRTPAILEEQVVGPLLIAGQGRSGTTILFELLAQDPNNRAPLGWEAASPVAPPDPTLADGISRAEIGECDNELWDDVAPEMLAAHEHRWNLPVECIHFMALEFSSDYWSALYAPSGYLRWRARTGVDSAYQWHKKILQLLQHGGSTPRWLLKSAAHTRNLAVLLQQYPDMRIIQTHRDPLKTIASTVSLTGYLRWCRMNDVDLQLLAKMICLTTRDSLQQVMQERADGVIPAGQIADVHFQDLMADPVATIRDAYQKLGLESTKEYGDKIRAYLVDKPRDKFGKHRYAAEDYGLSDEQIRQDFLFYTDHYSIALEAGG